MLTSGMVPALFPDDEKEAILNQVWQAIMFDDDVKINDNI